MENISYTLIWWIWLILIGLISIPLSSVLFNRFFDKGYGLTKIVTILFTSYFVFFFSTLKMLPFSRMILFLTIIIYGGLNLWLYSKNKNSINTFFKKMFGLLIFEEVLFSAGLFMWAFVRAHQPDINGLEKLMDFGFVNTILRSVYLPPIDMWASGLSINYYWYGHYITAYLTKLINVPSGNAYNLMLGTILGLSLTASFSIVSALLWNSFRKKFKTAVVVGGLLSAILMNFAGNFHTPFYILKNGVDKYWYPDATRFIGYNPDIDDKTIHEFPIYSYVVSDLHAHLLNLPFVLLYLALLYSFVASINKSKKHDYPRYLSRFNNFRYFFLNNFSGRLILIGFLLGVMFMTNAWDLANYLLVTGFVLLFAKVKLRKIKSIPSNLLTITSIILTIIITALVSSIPFLINFQSIAQGVETTHTKTPLWQLAILWGFPATLTVIYYIWRNLTFKKFKKENLYISALICASWMLILIPELIYVKDIYSITHYRANTMFKLTYQAYVMFYLSSGYIAITFLKTTKYLIVKIIFILIFSGVFAAVLYYPFLAVKSYYGNVFDKTNLVKELSGDGWLKERYPDTFESILWLNSNIVGQPTILEAPGDSYTDYNVISSYTGLPTVSGWYVHEWLWRGSPDFPAGRVSDITQIYNTESPEVAKSLLKKYSVEYVVVGSFEKEKFPDLIEDKFTMLGRVVFANQTSRIYSVD